MERNSDDHEGGKRTAQFLFFTGVKREPAPNTCGMGCERLNQCNAARAIEAAARAAREEERERCAKIAEDDFYSWPAHSSTEHITRHAVAAAIRKETGDA